MPSAGSSAAPDAPSTAAGAPDPFARVRADEDRERAGVPAVQRLLMWGGLVLLSALFVVFAHVQRDSPGLDMQVYWRGAQVLHGLNPSADYLYAPSLVDVGGLDLPFTYPPAAAILFYPLGSMSLEGAWSVLKVLNAVLIAVFAWLVLRLAPASRSWFLIRPAPTLLGFAATLVLSWQLFPIRFTFSFGQINLLLAALILADLARRRSGGAGTGLLTGVASGLKITPAAMGLVPLVQGQWRTIAGMGIGVLVTIIGAALVLPREVLDYFTAQLFSTGRVGDDGRISNQSLNGLLHLWGVPESLTTPLWLLLVVAVIVLGALGIRRTARAGDPFSATVLGALVMLLISPITWEHHWVWVLPLLFALVPDRPRQAPLGEWAVTALLALMILVAFSDNPSVLAAGWLGDTTARVVLHGPPALERLSTVPVLVGVLAGAWVALRPRAADPRRRGAQDRARA